MEELKQVPAVPRRRESLVMQVVREITTRINGGELQPGDKLPSEQEYCESFGVSRSVVREAISSLRARGLIATQQGVGAFVQKPAPSRSFEIDERELETLQEVVSALDLRICVEAEAAALAALRRSDEQLRMIKDSLVQLLAGADGREPGVEADFRFHRSIAVATNNRYFVEILSFLSTMLMPRMRVDLFKGDEAGRRAYVQGVNNEHEEIFRAIEAGDPEQARHSMRLHLSRSRERLYEVCIAQGHEPLTRAMLRTW